MAYRHLNLLLVCFLLKLWTPIADGTTCLPRYHPFTEFTDAMKVYKRRDFTEENSGYYTEIVIDQTNNNILVGARNGLFVLDAEKFVIKKNITWNDRETTETCLKSGRKKSDCQNYVQLLKPFKDKLFICGTNAMRPVYNITKLKDPSHVIEGNKDAKGRCSLKFDFPPVASFTKLDELISSTYLDKNGRDSVISGAYLDARQSSWYPTRTEQYNIKILRYPDFKASFAVFPSVFVFFNEIAAERSEKSYASVARICQTDNGGSMHILESEWTTLRKARLECVVPGYHDMEFNLLENIKWNEATKKFYGIFRTSNSSFQASAMCVFSLEEMKKVFDGDFLYKEDLQSSWKRVKNPGHFSECTINPSSLKKYSMKTYNDTVQPGKEPTNLMTGSALTDSYRYRLMYNSIKAVKSLTFHRKMERFTAIAVDDIKRGDEHEVLAYISTGQGSVIVLHINNAEQIVCILDEIHIMQKKNLEMIKKLAIWKEKQQLLLGTNSRIIKISLDVCSRYKNKSACIEARHPGCAWVTSKRSCMSLWNRTSWEDVNEEDLLQDLSRCPPKRGYWSVWSEWHTCKDGSSERSCRCRKRRCRTCVENDCIGNSIQLFNCSATVINDKESWLEKGVVDGAWSKWSTWSKCDHDSCGSGFQTRERSCDQPRQKNGGLPCIGMPRECRKCEVKLETRAKKCIHKIVEGMWSNCICFMEEGKSISVGVQFRVRTCFSSCGNKKGCPTDQIQNRTCMCNNKLKASGSTGTFFTARPYSGSLSARTGKTGFQLTDLIITVVATALICLVLCGLIIFYFTKCRKKNRHDDQSQPPGRQDRSGSDFEQEHNPLSSDTDHSFENGKHLETMNLDNSVDHYVERAFKTTKSPRNGKLKMFGEGQEYEMGITSF